MSTTHHPQYGARFQLTRTQHAAETATYRCDVYFPDRQLQYQTQLSIEHGVLQQELASSQPESADPPEEWAQQHLHFLYKQLLREAQKTGNWPRRTRQWKREK